MSNWLPDSAEGYTSLTELGRGERVVTTLTSVREGPQGSLAVLKRVRETVAEDDRYMRTFRLQLPHWEQISHKNLIHMRGFLSNDRHPTLASEYLLGQSLNRVLDACASARIPFPNPLWVQTVLGATEGLAYLHGLSDEANNPLVHRDISPRTIFISYDGQVKASDFGVARLNAGDQTGTGTGAARGRFAYSAPEVFQEHPLHPSADVYSLGALLWEALTGERYLAKMSGAAVVRTLMTSGPPDVRGTNTAVDEDIARVCMRALCPDPSQRYQTAGTLLGALELAGVRELYPTSQKEMADFLGKLFAKKKAQEEKRLKKSLDAQRHLLKRVFGFASASKRPAPEEPRTHTDDDAPDALVLDADPVSRQALVQLLTAAGLNVSASSQLEGPSPSRHGPRVVVLEVSSPDALKELDAALDVIRSKAQTKTSKVVLVSAAPPLQFLAAARAARVDALVERDRAGRELAPIVSNLTRIATLESQAR